MNTIIFNADYSPLGYIYWVDAFDLVYAKKASVMEEYDETFRTPSFEAKIPKKIILKKYVNYRQNARYSKRNIFLRDDYKCIYCGVDVTRDTAELEHILPRSRGGKTTWENTGTSCHDCNNRKDNMTPDEAGLKLRYKPYKPSATQWVEMILKNKMGEKSIW